MSKKLAPETEKLLWDAAEQRRETGLCAVFQHFMLGRVADQRRRDRNRLQCRKRFLRINQLRRENGDISRHCRAKVVSWR